MSLITQLLDRVKDKAPKGKKRSSGWRKVRKEHLKKHPYCAICRGKKKLEVHHKIPFHLAPDLELFSSNLVTLCERKKYGINCHLLIGHRGNYRKFNDDVDMDIIIWYNKIKED